MKHLLPVVILGLWATPIWAQLPMAVDVDHAAFAYDTDHTMVEVYLAFGASSLEYVADGDRYKAGIPMTMRLFRATDAQLEGTPVEAIWEGERLLAFSVPDTSGLAEGQVFVDQARLTVPPGEYQLRVTLSTQGEAKELELRRDLLVPDYSDTSRSSLSDIALATAITPTQDRENPFYKNGLIIRPNANQLYGEGMTRLFYYAEAYNVENVATDAGAYSLTVYIAEANRPQPLPGLQKRSERIARTPDVLAGSFELDSLPTGSYFLRLAVLNEKNEAKIEQSRKFFVYNTEVASADVVALESSFEESPYVSMPEQEVEKEFSHIRTIATESEWRRGRRIEDLDEKRRFLMTFWQNRDPDRSTPFNESRDEFYGRVQYANERYSVRGTEGWETDRGQTLVKYGVPTAIEPHLYDRGMKPYEIWQYNNISGEGQSVFIFADLDGFGEFELVHSSVAGERKLANWQTEIREGY